MTLMRYRAAERAVLARKRPPNGPQLRGKGVFLEIYLIFIYSFSKLNESI